jgi:4-aminobutyrate aminotransferase-like enzyme
MLSALTPSPEITNKVVLEAINQGLILFWLLYEPKAIRITPPLTISFEELEQGCTTILNILDSISENC